jgi:hypothetical protein
MACVCALYISAGAVFCGERDEVFPIVPRQSWQEPPWAHPIRTRAHHTSLRALRALSLSKGPARPVRGTAQMQTLRGVVSSGPVGLAPTPASPTGYAISSLAA